MSVATMAGPEVSTITGAGFDWYPIKVDRGGMSPIRDLETVVSLYRLYSRLRPDIVYHVTNKPILYGTFAARMAGVPKVVNAVSGLGHLFGGGRRLQAAMGLVLFRLLMRHPNMHVILQNTDDLQFFRDNRLAPTESLHLIKGSGVDTDVFKPSSDAPTRPVVLQTSRMLADKGVREFIAAARMVKARRPDVRFLLVGGSDPYNPTSIPEEELQAAATEGAVEWLGHRTDIAELLSRATIYCLPSFYREGVPLSLIEAAASALPLVTTDSTGCREVVTDRETGLLVPPRDANKLAEAVTFLLDHPDLAKQMGAKARERAVGEFSLERVLRDILAVCAEPVQMCVDTAASAAG